MRGRDALFSFASVHWATPAEVLDALNAEFGPFTLDPCPLSDSPAVDGLALDWTGHAVYCNPPYGRGVGEWLAKGRTARVAVFLLPARTDTRWWHEHAPHASEIRFLKGRLKFGGAKAGAPFPSVVLVFTTMDTAGLESRQSNEVGK